MTPQVHSIELPTGVRLEYAEQGDPGGVPLLLLHGATDSRRSWDTVLPHLPHSAGQARAPYQGEHDRREQHAQEDGAAGPISSNSVFASAAPNWTEETAANTSRVGGTG